MENFDGFLKNISGKSISFIGFGISHREILPLFLNSGAKIKVCDKNKELLDISEFKNQGVEFFLGDDYLLHIEADYIFRTPGMRFFTEELSLARKKGCIVTSETEVLFSFCKGKIYGITGSDGKTTSSTILAKILEQEGKTVFLGGNIGTPILPKIREIKEGDAVVYELSSFQLISMRQSPHTAIITNISPNHLDMHADMDEYVTAKTNIFLHQHGGSLTVLNKDDARSENFSKDVRDEYRMFSRKSTVKRGAFLSSDGYLTAAMDGILTKICHKDEIIIPGVHNIENYLAVFAALLGEASFESMREVATTFEGVEHRIEFVRDIDGVRWYNDVIATTPSRTKSALNAFGRKLTLIAGGSDKGLNFRELTPYLDKYVDKIYVSGDTAEKIIDAVRLTGAYARGNLRIIRVNSMTEAVVKAHGDSRPDDIILLSPASASFDAYSGYNEKGRHFKELVRNLK